MTDYDRLWVSYLAMAQIFALERLHDICAVMASNWPNWTSELHCGSKSGHSSFRTPVSGVADLIKMEFTTSTAYVAEIRLAGLVVLRDVIEVSTVLWFFCGSGRYKHIHRYLLHLLTIKIRNLWYIIMLLSSFFPPPFLWLSTCRYHLPPSPPPPLSETEWHHDFHHNQHQHPTTMNDAAIPIHLRRAQTTVHVATHLESPICSFPYVLFLFLLFNFTNNCLHIGITTYRYLPPRAHDKAQRYYLFLFLSTNLFIY